MFGVRDPTVISFTWPQDDSWDFITAFRLCWQICCCCGGGGWCFSASPKKEKETLAKTPSQPLQSLLFDHIGKNEILISYWKIF